MGWKAPSDWKGNPPKGKFLKAKEYLERAETVIPIMRSENKKLKDELAEARADLKSFKEETGKTVAKWRRCPRSRWIASAPSWRTSIPRRSMPQPRSATRIRSASSAMPSARTSRNLTRQGRGGRPRSRPEDRGGQGTSTQALPKDVQDTIGGWIAENNWYSTDPEMQAVANAHHGKLLKDKPGLTLAENLEETRKYVAKRYPEKFGKADGR
jgi:hypothetical protein